MPLDPPLLTRRTTLGAAVIGLVAVSGCDLDDLDPRSDPAPPGEPVASAPSQDADTALVAGVVAALGEMSATVAALRRRERTAFRSLLQLHRRHLAELDGARPTIAGTRVPATEVVAREQVLQTALADAAVTAESGELARVLAAMSAAVAQQLAVLGPAAPR